MGNGDKGGKGKKSRVEEGKKKEDCKVDAKDVKQRGARSDSSA